MVIKVQCYCENMKTTLQTRAEIAAKNFNTARKPIVFEFAGVPKAGKQAR